MNISLKSAHNAASQQFISRKKEVFFVAIFTLGCHHQLQLELQPDYCPETAHV